MGNTNIKLTEEEKKLKNATDPAGAMTAPTETSAQLYEQYAGRQPFSYDINSDALYEQYANQYAKGGKLPMEDTLGKAASMTGGYASSYAQTAAQQTFNEYMSELNNMVPQLEQKAYDRYAAEGDDLLARYTMALERERTAIDDQRYAEETAYKREKDKITNDRLQKQLDIQAAGSSVDLKTEDFTHWTQDDFRQYAMDISEKYGSEIALGKIDQMVKNKEITQTLADVLKSEALYGKLSQSELLQSFTPVQLAEYFVESAKATSIDNAKAELDYYVQNGIIPEKWYDNLKEVLQWTKK